MTTYGKVEFPSGRYDWHPTPLPEQVVLITTVDGQDQPHVATKSRISVVSYGPPTFLIFACRSDYPTASNLREVSEFVVNVPGDDLVATSWVIGKEPSARGPTLFSENGLTPIPSLKVRVPRISECRAHIECEVEDIKNIRSDLVVFGRVMSVSMNANVAEGDEADGYERLAPFFFLSTDWTASLGASRRVEEPVPGPRHDVTVLATRDLDKAVQFYSKAFGWPLRLNKTTYVEFELGGGRSLALCQREEMGRYLGEMPAEAPAGRLAGVELGFYCEDLPQTIEKLIAAGAFEISELSKRISGVEAAYYADPDGNVIFVYR